MKRLLPLAPLPLLLLLTMGVGPCDSKPLGSVDGCTYNGKTYAVGVAFPASDGCNSCSCENGSVACTLKACLDASRDATIDGTAGMCLDANGKLIACPGRDAGTSMDSGTVDAGSACLDVNGKVIPCWTDAGTSCTYYGKVYMIGASFPCADGCNSCACTANGVGSTGIACVDSGTPTDGATDGPTCFNAAGASIPCATDGGLAGVCMPGADQTCNDNPMMNAVIGKCRPDFTCDCGSNAINPMTGRCTTAAVTDCAYNGVNYPVGSKFMCGMTSGCNSGTCYCATPGQITELCPGEPLPVCGFDAVYTYGQTGGRVAYSDQVTLTPPASYVLTRTVSSSAGGAMGGSCGPALPACATSPIGVDDIMAAIADPTVQLLISLSMMQPTLVGIDQRPVDGTIFSFKKSGTAGFLVGAPCNGASNCTEIPGAVSTLESYLLKLEAQQGQDPSCAFLGKM